MAKGSSPGAAAAKPDNFGKGKVTPVQVAFIVDRYLADNNFGATLSSFRSEASHLFSRTRGKEVPKGLLGLADILDEYIRLKEQKVIVDQEKRRVESLLQGIQDAVVNYHSSGGPQAMPPPQQQQQKKSLPPPNLPPQAARRLLGPPLPSNITTSAPPPGNMLPSMSLVNPIPPPMLPVSTPESNYFSTPNSTIASRSKRKTSNPAPRAPPAPKKYRSQPSTEALVVGGIRLPSQINAISSTHESTESCQPVELRVAVQPASNSAAQGSSVAKMLFTQQPDSCAKLLSSPKTPPQPSPSQSDKSDSPPEDELHSEYTTASTFHEMTPSKCSMVSKLVVISPSKSSGYYSVERSHHHVSISPLKPSPRKQGKRDHVKGRLDFDESQMPSSSREFTEAQICTTSTTETIQTQICTTSTTETTQEDIFDLDFPDIDMDFSFSQLLVDFDLDGEGMAIPYEQTSGTSSDTTNWSSQEIGSSFLEFNEDLPSITNVTSEKGMNIQAADSLRSVRTITKSIKIVSPAKHQASSMAEQKDLPSTN